MSQQFKFDTASAISQGGREAQEDALIADFARGSGVGMAILSDGMGGHVAGALASKIVVTEVFSELVFRQREVLAGGSSLTATLRAAAESANECLASYVLDNPEVRGMGATLAALVIVDDALHWISIGDSPLLLFRDNKLVQLNEDHSLAPHIDLLVRTGAMSEAEGENHPERNSLTSVLVGRTIPQVDCPEEPLILRPGDVILLASDGLQYLNNDEIAEVLRDHPMSRSADIADLLMSRLAALEDPDLDNISLTILQVQDNARTSIATAGIDAVGKMARAHWPFSPRGAKSSDDGSQHDVANGLTR